MRFHNILLFLAIMAFLWVRHADGAGSDDGKDLKAEIQAEYQRLCSIWERSDRQAVSVTLTDEEHGFLIDCLSRKRAL